jgi:hypothetical protein
MQNRKGSHLSLFNILSKPKKDHKMAFLHLYQGKIYVSTYHRTVAGYWYSEGVNVVINEEDVISLHSAINEALAKSTENFPTPTYDDKRYVTSLKLAGVKSIRTFEKQGKAIEIILKEGQYHLTPCRKFEKMAGFEQMIEHTVLLPEGSEGIAGTALKLFEIAT